MCISLKMVIYSFLPFYRFAAFEGPNLNVRVLFKCRIPVFMTQYFCTENMNSVTEHSLLIHPDVFTLISIRIF
jgi:hypothetical protein